MKRDPMAEEQIELAHERPPRILTTNHPEITDPVERERLGLRPLEPPTFPTLQLPGCTCHSCGTWTSTLLDECSACGALLIATVSQTKEPTTILRGHSHTTYQRFVTASKAMAQHQAAGASVMAEYKAALEELSREAAK